ncbi:unnamed protein product [Dovyalis caffra]|uniref:Galectin domain-containing protein n=1 Tax=Dovyalis caffra TaxID=77055 RepID=A0AAV1RDD8_9ROSI|nr:unnamed protein product [Dovyalis caffra]
METTIILKSFPSVYRKAYQECEVNVNTMCEMGSCGVSLLSVATLRVGIEGIQTTVDGKHITSFVYHETLELWLLSEVWISRDLKLISVVASGESRSHCIWGWDVSDMNFEDAMARAKVFGIDLQNKLWPYMESVVPLPGIYYPDFIGANQGSRANNAIKGTKKEQVQQIIKDIREFKEKNKVPEVKAIKFGSGTTNSKLILLIFFKSAQPKPTTLGSMDKLSRYSFPDGFVFGAGTSAYQYEGETNRSGKGPNIWDTFIEEHTERITDHSNANVAVYFYHHYKEDVQRMKEMGIDVVRFSISWSRVLPHGRLSAGINEEGIQFYNNLIDELIKNGYNLFLSFDDENDFRDFVEFCFQKFGDRVKNWITLNEPFIFSVYGYDTGVHAPGRISTLENSCPGQPKISGATEVYMVSHHLLLAHATAVKVYKEKYQACQGGQIGITLVCHWFEPYSNSEGDQNAVKRSLDFMLGCYMSPLTTGDYPQNMHDYVGGRLPKFSEEESKMLIGSYDFIGINYYTTYYARNVDDVNYKNIGYMEDARVTWPGERNGIPIGPQTNADWIYIHPEGIRHLLNYVKDVYGNPTIYITENGVDDVKSSSLEEALNDPIREKSYQGIFHNVLKSINDHGVDVRGFFAWSFLDDFEWQYGYGSRYGFYYIDYENDLKRYAKNSVKWFKQFLKKDKNIHKDNITSKIPSDPRMKNESVGSRKKPRT